MAKKIIKKIRSAKRKIQEYKKHTKNVVMDINEVDKNKVWAFCAGQYSRDFRGNPKYLFIYINKYRKDITSYWLCDDENTIDLVRKLGYRAYLLGTSEAELAINKTGVLVSEFVKQEIPRGLENVKYLNLWHGVGGVKNVERSIDDGILLSEIAKKYIGKNEFYLKNQLYLATSKVIVDIAKNQLGVTEDRIIKAGYPRNVYQKKYEKISTFNSDFIKERDLPKDTKIIAYTPTYRMNGSSGFLKKAFPDIKKLIELCNHEHYLFIFKMHPILENDVSFSEIKELYKDNKWLLFWDNTNDFYEIMDKVDLCIYDFSSIFTDFVASGTKHFIRYNFDNIPDDLNTPIKNKNLVGNICNSYDELLNEIKNFKKYNYEKEIKHIMNYIWEYSTENDLENIVDQTLAYKIKDIKLPTLYSFDIFDTLISRKVVDPLGIFYYVKDKIINREDCPQYVKDNFPEIRRNAELNVREYYNRTQNERNDTRCEIQFDQIYERIKTVYGLDDKLISDMKSFELEAELDNVIPIKSQIDKVKELIDNNEKVILISDMYLKEDFIKKMLKKADPILVDLELYLSSTYGYQKSKQTLYLEIYKKYGEKYNFEKWIHTGDNPISDKKKAQDLNITYVSYQPLVFNDYEKNIVKTIRTYDAYLLAGMLARFRREHFNIKEQFVYSYISLLFVPYIYWAIHDSVNQGDQIDYFISRDGFHLKRIADAIIKEEKLSLETKYIYASRKTWRVPSFIDKIDVDFWGEGHGNFSDISNFNNLLKALSMDEKKFKEMFPELYHIKNEKWDKKYLKELVHIFSSSKKYEEYLLNYAKEKRESVCGYLEQEIDINKKYSVIEYWGRGYTQENFTRLWHHINKKSDDVVFYYSRSTLPSEGNNIRKNFSVNSAQQLFIEFIFNCIDYKSIVEYKKKNNKWEPIIEKNSCDEELLEAMKIYLPEFAKEYVNTSFLHIENLGRSLFDYVVNFYIEQPTNEMFVKVLSNLKDNHNVYGSNVSLAKSITNEDLEKLIKKEYKMKDVTSNFSISLAKSKTEIQEKFNALYQTYNENGINKIHKILTEDEFNQYEKCKNKLENELAKSNDFNKLYQKYKNLSIQNKVLIITNTMIFDELEFIPLINELSKNYDVETISLKSTQINLVRLAKKIATSKYIILKKPLSIFANVDFKEETKLIYVPDTVISYFKIGRNKYSRIDKVVELAKLPYEKEPDIIQIPSNTLMCLYNDIYNIGSNSKILYNGSVLTDIYFDEEIRKNIKKSVLKECKFAKDKKIICYLPFNRYRNKKSKYLDILDLNLMKEKLGDEYVLLININDLTNTEYMNKLNIKGFSKNVSQKFSLREMMIAADIIISDYRDTVFESPILNKPIFLTDWDSMDFDSHNNVSFNFNNNKYGVSIKNTDDLIDKIKNLDSYDYSNQNEFRKKYLKECDGNSSHNLVEYLKKIDK